jgi:dUTP pyrophosphatase
VKIEVLKDHPDVQLPEYATEGAAGADLRAFFAPEGDQEILIPPLGRAMIPTGLRFAIEPGYEVQIRPRSGLAIKNGITVINSPGTIDEDYRGPVALLIANLGQDDFTIRNGDRIAQMVAAPVSRASFLEVEDLSDTVRGEGGFGSTGFS